MKRKDSLSRKAMKLLCTLLGLVLVFLLGATLLFRSYLEQINYTPVKQDNSIQAVFSQLSFSDSSSGRIGGANSGLTNILLIGQDAREGESQSQARSDSMILCTYNKNTRQLTMTSFLRDLYVPIPGHGSNRINAAYAYGGADLLKRPLTRISTLPSMAVWRWIFPTSQTSSIPWAVWKSSFARMRQKSSTSRPAAASPREPMCWTDSRL